MKLELSSVALPVTDVALKYHKRVLHFGCSQDNSV